MNLRSRHPRQGREHYQISSSPFVLPVNRSLSLGTSGLTVNGFKQYVLLDWLLSFIIIESHPCECL